MKFNLFEIVCKIHPKFFSISIFEFDTLRNIYALCHIGIYVHAFEINLFWFFSYRKYFKKRRIKK